MRLMIGRITVRELMILVGLICIILGAFRAHFSLGCFVTGAMAIAALRTTGKLEQLRLTGHPIRNRDRLRIIGAAFMAASALLTASLLPGLCLLPYLVWQGRRGASVGAVFAILLISGLSWPISVAMRRLMW